MVEKYERRRAERSAFVLMRPQVKVIKKLVKTNVLVILVSITLLGCQQNQGSQPPTGRYQLVVDANGNAWRVDSTTGETKRCWQGTPGVRAPFCVAAAQE